MRMGHVEHQKDCPRYGQRADDQRAHDGRIARRGQKTKNGEEQSQPEHHDRQEWQWRTFASAGRSSQ